MQLCRCASLRVKTDFGKEVLRLGRSSAKNNRIYDPKRPLPTRDDLMRALAQIAFGRANDCIRLALDPSADTDALDLTLLTELKRAANGAVEVRLADRLEAIERLIALCPETDGAEGFLKALADGVDTGAAS